MSGYRCGGGRSLHTLVADNKMTAKGNSISRPNRKKAERQGREGARKASCSLKSLSLHDI